MLERKISHYIEHFYEVNKGALLLARHRALNNILDCPEYDIPQAVVLCNSNVEVKGNVVYVPIYMMMFLCKERETNIQFHLDLSGL